ncbi:capsule assembly Wzi family protein [Cecembia rubra]|nr:capsule assembly Wzi family protein [Cecembia rubra]
MGKKKIFNLRISSYMLSSNGISLKNLKTSPTFCFKFLFSFFSFLFVSGLSFAQKLQVGAPLLEEYLRRQQILNSDSFPNYSFSNRQFYLESIPINEDTNYFKSEKKLNFKVLPFFSTVRFNDKRPFGWGDYGMINANGLQNYLSTGFFSKLGSFSIQFQPELFYSQNKDFQGFSRDFSDDILWWIYRFSNLIDNPERIPGSHLTKLTLGQSFVSYKFKKIEIAVSNRSIWWGPGQWNSLTFSNNARSFPHISFNTVEPLKSFLGDFEFQIILGKLRSSFVEPFPYDDLNALLFIPFENDWRYLNGMTFSYQPKWIPGLYLGLSRTFQQYSIDNSGSFSDIFPIFEAFQKERFFVDDNTVIYDGKRQDQQAVLFTRYLIPKAYLELYFEFGRRDHALNWREMILNPDHARAYQLGFKKLIKLGNDEKAIQLRGEITHQQESVSRYIRYDLPGGSWHTHGSVLTGNTNFGKSLGVGTGLGANSQSFEISLVNNFNKLGILLQRIENNQDFYYASGLKNYGNNPWIDLSGGVLADFKQGNFLISSKIQIINGINYQWQFSNLNMSEFPKNSNLISMHVQSSFYYFF